MMMMMMMPVAHAAGLVLSDIELILQSCSEEHSVMWAVDHTADYAC